MRLKESEFSSGVQTIIIFYYNAFHFFLMYWKIEIFISQFHIFFVNYWKCFATVTCKVYRFIHRVAKHVLFKNFEAAAVINKLIDSCSKFGIPVLPLKFIGQPKIDIYRGIVLQTRKSLATNYPGCLIDQSSLGM